MNKYQKGKIYKVVDVGYNLCYVGSTIESVARRMAKHRNHYKDFKAGIHNKNYIRLFDIFDEYGVDSCKIELIENYPCSSKEELEAREGHHQQNNQCVNKNLAGRSRKQWREDNREYLLQGKKEDYCNNREYRMKLMQDRYETEKTKRMTCECGSEFRCCWLKNHIKTEKHQEYLQSQKQD